MISSIELDFSNSPIRRTSGVIAPSKRTKSPLQLCYIHRKHISLWYSGYKAVKLLGHKKMEPQAERAVNLIGGRFSGALSTSWQPANGNDNGNDPFRSVPSIRYS